MTAEFDWSQFQEEAPKQESKFDFSKFEEAKKPMAREHSLGKSLLKGGIKGAFDLSALVNPVEAFITGGLNEKDMELLNRILPTEDKSLENVFERAGRLGVGAIGGPESLAIRLLRIGGGAALGQLAEEAGAPEIVQDIAELATLVAPKGKFIPKKSQEQVIKFLKEKGLSDKEIVPLIRKQGIVNRNLQKLSASENLKKFAQNTSEKLGENYNVLKSQGKEKFLRGADVVAFDDKLSEKLSEITPGYGRLIEKEIETLRNKGVSQKNLIEFYQDINRVVKGQHGGKAVLNKLKPIVVEGLEKIDPIAANEYKLLNEYYSKNKDFLKKVTPGLGHQIYNAGKLVTTIGLMATGNFWGLKGYVSELALKKISKEFLTNPKLQNLGKQVVESVKSNNLNIARQLAKRFQHELSDESKKSLEED